MVRLLTNILLPLLVFSFLIFAGFQFILRQSLKQTGLQVQIHALCHPDLIPLPYLAAYTNNHRIDALLCGMVVFFQALIDPANKPVLATLFPAIGVIVLILYLEAGRDRRSFALGMPTPVATLGQLLSMGVIMPVYAILFVITGAASARPPPTPSLNVPSKINQGNAEALLFGILVGYILPTALMLSLNRPSVTATWQAFPFLITFAIFLHQSIRPPSHLVQSGHLTILVTLTSSFILSALLHVIYVWPVLPDVTALKRFFIPIALGDQVEMPLEDVVLEFIKWDMIFGIGAIALATLWIADNTLVILGILAWHGISTIVLGPAAALAGVFLWRERWLNGQNHVRKMHKASQKMD